MRILLVLALSTALTGHLLLMPAIWTYADRLDHSSYIRDTTRQKLAELIRTYAKASGFNGSVLVGPHGTSLPNKGYGLHLFPEQLQTCTGLYEFPQIGFTFRIRVWDGSHYGQNANRPGARSTRLPTDDDHFITADAGDADCWFHRKTGTRRTTDAPLSCAPVRLPQRGRTFTGKKSK